MDAYLTTLTKLRSLLVSCGDQHWGPRVQAFVQQYEEIREEERSKYVEHFQKVLRATSGGMGSLSDLTFSKQGGHLEEDHDLLVANQQKDALLDQLYEICKSRLTELNRS
jgi:hypothetical protein